VTKIHVFSQNLECEIASTIRPRAKSLSATAALGVGNAFSLILEANPLKPKQRQIVQTVTQKILAKIGSLKAARCCQRDSWIALTMAAALSVDILPIALQAEANLICHQQKENAECIGAACPVINKKLK